MSENNEIKNGKAVMFNYFYFYFLELSLKNHYPTFTYFTLYLLELIIMVALQ